MVEKAKKELKNDVNLHDLSINQGEENYFIVDKKFIELFIAISEYVPFEDVKDSAHEIINDSNNLTEIEDGLSNLFYPHKVYNKFLDLKKATNGFE